MAEEKAVIKPEDINFSWYPKQGDEIPPLGYVTGTNIPRARNKVAIMGFAPTSMEMVRTVWDDPDLEIWGLNQMHIAFPALVERATRWWQIHPKHSYNQNFGRDYSHHDWLKQQTKFPIYMAEQQPDVPTSVRWPKERVITTLETDYFTNCISWMLSLAILEGFGTIYIFGVDMAQSDEIDSEYSEQRPSCEYFIGFARGVGFAYRAMGHPERNVKVIIPDSSDLLKTMWLYPYEDHSPFRTKMEARRQELRNRMAQLAQQEQSLHDQRLQIIGAIEDVHYVKRCWDQSVNELTQQNKIVKQYVEGDRKPITE